MEKFAPVYGWNYFSFKSTIEWHDKRLTNVFTGDECGISFSLIKDKVFNITCCGLRTIILNLKWSWAALASRSKEQTVRDLIYSKIYRFEDSWSEDSTIIGKVTGTVLRFERTKYIVSCFASFWNVGYKIFGHPRKFNKLQQNESILGWNFLRYVDFSGIIATINRYESKLH